MRIRRSSGGAAVVVGLGDEQAGGVRAAVEGGAARVEVTHAGVRVDRSGCRRRLEVLGHPAADRVVAAGEVPGVVGVEALHARCGCRRPRRGRGPASVDGIAASRSAA